MGAAPVRRLNDLYFGPSAEEKRKEILNALEEGRPLPALYLITFASNSTDQLDILPSYMLRLKSVRKRLPLLAGAAFGRQEALELVGRIASEAYKQTGACMLQSFLLRRDAGELSR